MGGAVVIAVRISRPPVAIVRGANQISRRVGIAQRSMREGMVIERRVVVRLGRCETGRWRKQHIRRSGRNVVAGPRRVHVVLQKCVIDC